LKAGILQGPRIYQKTIEPMMDLAFPPFIYEAFLVPGVAGPPVEIFVVVVSINPMVKSGSQVTLGFLVDFFKDRLGIDAAIVTTLKKRKTAAVIRTQTTNRAY
jgi:hypothetical protein